MDSPARVTLVDIKESRLGKITLKFACRSCNVKLTSQRSDIGQIDLCPECGAEFFLDPSIEQDIQKMKSYSDKEKERQKQNRQIEKEASRTEKKEERKKKEELNELEKSEYQFVREPDYLNKCLKSCSWAFLLWGVFSLIGLNLFSVFSETSLIIIGLLFRGLAILRDIRFILGRNAIEENRKKSFRLQ